MILLRFAILHAVLCFIIPIFIFIKQQIISTTRYFTGIFAYLVFKRRNAILYYLSIICISCLPLLAKNLGKTPHADYHLLSGCKHHNGLFFTKGCLLHAAITSIRTYVRRFSGSNWHFTSYSKIQENLHFSWTCNNNAHCIFLQQILFSIISWTICSGTLSRSFAIYCRFFRNIGKKLAIQYFS